MRILLDEGVPRSCVRMLAEHSHDVVHVGDVGMLGSSDRKILERAIAEERLVVTFDADFHAMLALEGLARPSVVRLRVQGLRAAGVSALILQVLATCSDDLEAGAVVTCGNDRVRVRRLPIE
jgi:predicted nuclease of predicted toxin-antitoxin system